MMHKYVLIGIMVGILSSCTLSFQNIDTHGSATDLVDQTQDTSPTVSPDVNVPVSVIPQ